MKITFLYSDSPDIAALPSYDILKTTWTLPDEIVHLIGYEKRLRFIINTVGELTQANLHVTCAELDMKKEPVQLIEDKLSNFLRSARVTLIEFTRLSPFTHRKKTVKFKIYTPLYPDLPHHFFAKSGKRSKSKRVPMQLGDAWCQNDEQRRFADSMSELIQQLHMLLSAEPVSSPIHAWQLIGYYPSFPDNQLITWNNKRGKQRAADEKKREKEAQKAQKAGNSTPHPKTGAGRRPGAIPGVFNGVQFRSQLEIRFATELESRGIEWIYELERLGDGNYLVDFYLPQLKTWVEVKGKFEPRDDYLLRDVAQYLKNERGERLFVYTSGRPFVVTDDEFQKVSKDEFWEILSNTQR